MTTVKVLDHVLRQIGTAGKRPVLEREIMNNDKAKNIAPVAIFILVVLAVALALGFPFINYILHR